MSPVFHAVLFDGDGVLAIGVRQHIKTRHQAKSLSLFADDHDTSGWR